MKKGWRGKRTMRKEMKRKMREDQYKKEENSNKSKERKKGRCKERMLKQEEKCERERGIMKKYCTVRKKKEMKKNGR